MKASTLMSIELLQVSLTKVENMLKAEHHLMRVRSTVHLKILVDKTSIEVFMDDGSIVYSNEIFPELNDKGITLFSKGGTAIFKNVVIKHFSSYG